MKKVSVIIPAYNSAGTIERCINSVISAENAETEVIVVNDGSTDNLEEVLEPYSDRVVLISIENAGVSNARNVGLKAATGDFVMFIDSDDCLMDGAVDELVRRQEETGADIVRCGYKLVYDDGSEKAPVYRFEKEELIKKSDFRESIYTCFVNGILLNSVCMTLFKREIIKELEFRLDMKTAEDAVFSMKAYTNASSVLLIPDMYYMYFQSAESLTGRGLKIIEKYSCNYVLSGEMARLLKSWGMDEPLWKLRVWTRPVRLTFNKLKRIKHSAS